MKRISYLLLALLCAWPLAAQEPLRYDLRDCIARALEQNYQLQIVRNQEQMAHNNATLANAGGLPSVDASAGFRQKTMDTNVALSWTLFDGFRMQTNYRQLRLLESQGQTATRLALEDLIADVSAEYYNYIQQVIRRRHYRYAMALSRERLRIAELNYQTGRFSGLDYHQAQVDFHTDSASYVRQREAVHLSRIRLNKLMANVDVDQRILIADSTIRVRDDLQLEALWQQTLSANASLLNAAQNMQLAELDLQKVTARNYPYLKLNTQYGHSGSPYDVDAIRDNHGFTGGLSVGVNLWDGNRRRERRNAELTIRNRELQRQQLELDLHASLTTFWMSYRNNLDLLDLQKQNLEIAENNLEIAMERYKLGNLSGFDMRQVQKALLDAEERVLQVEYDAKICEISLLQISGGIGWYLE